jgi:predicted ribosomally synthesized peptide with nif11-like leader
MSKESATAFLEKLRGDMALQSKVKEAGQSLVKVGKDAGYDFTFEEASDALHEIWKCPPSKEHIVYSEPPGY